MVNNELLIQGDDTLEASLLIGVLLFNETKQAPSRADMMQKALLALIIEGDGKVTAKDVLNTLKYRFGLSWTDQELNAHVQKLVRMQLVDVTETGLLIAREVRKNGKSVTRNVSDETKELLERIVDRTKLKFNGNIPAHIDLRQITRRALTAYYRHFGLEYVGLKKESTEEEKMSAIDVIKKDLPQYKRLAEILIRVLADTIQHPSPEDKVILEKWARAYITMQVIGLDPMLSNFKEGKLRGKSFVFDTDVVLNCIVKNAVLSKQYRTVLDKLKSIGCTLYIPDKVIEEVESYCRAARGNFSHYTTEQLLDLTDELLHTSVGNVLIEDYIRTIHIDDSMRECPFELYIENIYDREQPQLLTMNLRDAFGKSNMDNKLPAVKDEKKKDELAKVIFELTEQSPKGAMRTADVNREMSETDAVLYQTICEMNEECDEGDFFANKAYLLTSMTKVMRSAKELECYKENVFCSPNALLGILMENGILHDSNISMIDLLENPFLVYTAQQIWGEIEPLIKAGAKIKFKEINKLRFDVDTKIDKILTCQTKEERYHEAKELSDKGYFFGQDIIDATEKAAQLDALVIQQGNTIAEQNKQIEQLKDTISTQNAEIKKIKEDDDYLRRKEAYEIRVHRTAPQKANLQIRKKNK